MPLLHFMPRVIAGILIAKAPRMPEKIKILFLSAEPMNAARLRLGQEIRDIEEKLHGAPRGRSFQIVSQWAVRPQDLTEALMRHRPTVVHFSGHAAGGKLILEDEHGGAKPVEGKHLAELLAGFSNDIRLVVLNACFTSPEFDVLRNVIDYTVGTTAALADKAAIRFSSCFYQALAFDNPVQIAYERAKRQINAEESGKSGVFNLLIRRGVDVSESFIKPQKRSGAEGAGPSTEKTVTKNKARRRDAPVRKPKSATVSEDDSVYRTVGDAARSGTPSAERDSIPPHIQESLERFRRDYPDPHRVAFLMMRFGNTKAHDDIVTGIRAALDPLGISVVRADEKQYHDDLFPNVLTYIYGCGFGIAVFERIETEQFNPNVALEVGYMLAMKKDICLLKDRTLTTLQADLVGKLYRVFDAQHPITTIPQELSRWLRDKGLEGSPPVPPVED